MSAALAVLGLILAAAAIQLVLAWRRVSRLCDLTNEVHSNTPAPDLSLTRKEDR